MSRRLIILVAVAIGVAVAAGAVVSHVTASSDDAPLSNPGGPTIPIHGMKFGMSPITTGNVLSIRAGRAFYRLDATGDTCFGVGPADEIGTPGSAVCTHRSFPRESEPVLDFSVYEATRHDVREFSLFRAEGFAIDRVAAIRFLKPNGETALVVPVKDNVYATTTAPDGPVGGFVALDTAGKPLERSR